MRTPYRRLARAAVPAVVVPVLLTSLAACGGGDDSADAPSSPSTSASASGTPSGSAAAAPASGQTVDTADFTALVKRSIDKATTAQLGLQLVGSNGTITGTGQVDYTGRSPSLAVKLPDFGNADLRVVDREVYIKVASTGGNTFYKGNLDDPAVAAQLGSLGGFDPASSLQALTQSISTVTLVGTEQLQGDQVDHYVFESDPSGLAGGSASSSASSSSASSSAVTVDAWFDQKDLLRKTQTTLSDGTKVTLTLDDWGSPVDIEAPPAAQVKDLPSAAASQ